MNENEINPWRKEKEEEKMGREAIGIAEALEIQKKMCVYLAPKEILARIKNLDYNHDSNMEGDPVFDALFMRYMEMYVLEGSGGNDFAAFCDLNANDKELINRIATNTTTDEDLDKLYKFMVKNHEEPRPFFKDEEDVEAFLASVLEVETA